MPGFLKIWTRRLYYLTIWIFVVKLKIDHHSDSPERHRVELSIDDGSGAKAAGAFEFSLTPADQERLRWYWEDYLDYPIEPASDEARDAERRIEEVGTELFQGVFRDSAASRLWSKVQPRLASTRIEISAPAPQGSPQIPWELMRDPATGAVMSSSAESFVRLPSSIEIDAAPMAGRGDSLRILTLLSSPPCGPGDPFRFPSAQLLKFLNAETREKVRFSVLRPPTFGQLSSVLLEAEAMGEPYHVVHIDGYGVFSDAGMNGAPEEILNHYREPQFAAMLQGPHGYLVLGDATVDQNCHLIDGQSLAQVLKEAGVAMLTLAAAPPVRMDLTLEPIDRDLTEGTVVDAFHSIAHDAASHGVAAVLALPYGLDPRGAATALGRIYWALAHGETAGEAVTRVRKQLRDLPERQVTYGPVPLRDAAVPVIYETAPLRLLAGKSKGSRVQLPLEVLSKEQVRDDSGIHVKLPQSPVAGFIGRDDTMLALDRIFNTRSVALLSGVTGQGKTAAAIEFARWYGQTSGFDGAVLFTSFDYHKRLSSVLDQMAAVFGQALEKAGYQWATLPAEERLDVSLHVLNQIPVLWIWDNVGNVEVEDDVGRSPWTPEEQEELANFLRVTRETQAKFLLTSRPASRRWLGGMPAALNLPPLPMRERLQLARALAEKDGASLSDVDDWRPVLKFSEGNPLVVRCLVERMVHEGIETASQVRAFIEKLKSRASAAGEDNQETAAVDATLENILSQSLNQNEQRIVALLHLFHGVVNVQRLAAMGEGEESAAAPGIHDLREFRELKEDDPGSSVLDRMEALGLLASEGDGFYSIQSALPPFLEKLFDRQFPAEDDTRKEKRLFASFKALSQQATAPPATKATRAYVRAVSDFGLALFERFRDGDTAVAAELAADEANLRHACNLARRLEWWDLISGCIHGLGALFEGGGRIAEWQDFFDELMKECADEATQEPLDGRGLYWRAVVEQGVYSAKLRRRLHHAEKLQRLCLNWDREQANPYLSVAANELEDSQRAALERYALSLYRMGGVVRRQGFPEPNIDEEAVNLQERLGEKETASRWAFELGLEYTDNSALRDLQQAERWLQRSLELKEEEDRLGKGVCCAELGRVAWERFGEARKANLLQVELLRFLNDARQYYLRAIENDPPDDWAHLAAHNQELGHICFALGDLGRALPYYRESIRYYELEGATEPVAQIQFTLALSLRDASRMAEARKFAQDACANFKKIPDCDPEILKRAERILESIEQRIGETRQARLEQH